MGAVRVAWQEWNDELRPLRLSRGGRLAFSSISVLVLAVSALAGIAGVAFSFYNLFTGTDQDTAVAVQLIFVVGGVAVATVMLLGAFLAAIVVIDAAVRGVRLGLRRLAR